LEYASVVCKDRYVGIEHLPDYLFPASRDAVKGKEGSKSGILSWDVMQRELITQVLRINNWNRKAAAAQLGIHPTTLWRKTKRLGIEVPKENARKGT